MPRCDHIERDILSLRHVGNHVGAGPVTTTRRLFAKLLAIAVAGSFFNPFPQKTLDCRARETTRKGLKYFGIVEH